MRTSAAPAGPGSPSAGRPCVAAIVRGRTGGGGTTAPRGAFSNLTRTPALELAADRINVNNLTPGMVLTPFNQEAIDDRSVREERARHIPWGRAGEPAEVARLAVFLASDDADDVTGQTFTIDRGLSMAIGLGA